MKAQSLFLLPTALLLMQSGGAIASSQLLSANPASSSTAQTQSNEIPAPPWARDLNLSAEQRSRLKTVNDQARKEGEILHQKLMAAEKELRSLLQSNASIEQLRQKHRDVQQLRQQLDDNHFEALLGERQVLTPDQLAKVIEQVRKAPTAP
jgi:Spy/CpxP family protein refolding chaperone